MTLEELAKEAGVSARAIRKYAREGIIPGRNHGGRCGWVFSRDEAMQALSLEFGNSAEKEAALKAMKRRAS